MQDNKLKKMCDKKNNAMEKVHLKQNVAKNSVLA